MATYRPTKKMITILKLIYSMTKTNGRGSCIDLSYNPTETALVKRGLIAEGHFADYYVVTPAGMKYLNERGLHTCMNCNRYCTDAHAYSEGIRCNGCHSAHVAETARFFNLVISGQS